MKVAAIVQARMGSSRLPEKVLKTIINKPMIEILLTRLSQSRELNEIVVATSEYPQNDELQSIVEFLDYRCTRGSEKNVLNRFYEEAKTTNPDIVVRITGDCPLVDPSLVDRCIQSYKDLKVDYFLNTNPISYPDGMDVQVYSINTLKKSYRMTNSKIHREHVTLHIRKNPKIFNIINIVTPN